MKKVCVGISILTCCMLAKDVSLDDISVTATKIKTSTKEVSQAISVVNSRTIKEKNILNISDALENIPGVNAATSSNTPNPRLIIRGAGLKARYGVREIMVLKDGVPMTDPDSFTRFDYIDMQDVQSIEVQKGPGSINAVNATGGVIQLLTRSVFDEVPNRIKLGLGDDGQNNINLKLRSAIDDNDFVSFGFTRRQIDNNWRDNNEFRAIQSNLKYGHIFDDESIFESEIAYTKADANLPTSLNEEEYDEFVATGEQHDTSYQWQNSARNSKIFSINAKYEKEVGDFTYKPRAYFHTWQHFHPVTGLINDSKNNFVYGTDLEANNNHSIFGYSDTLVFGLTLKQDLTKNAKKYTYKDVEISNNKIIKTLSDEKGELAKVSDSTTSLYGIYAMETINLAKRLKMDISGRVDRLTFDIDENEFIRYDYRSKNYVQGDGKSSLDKGFTLLSSKLGLSYGVFENTNIYTSFAYANQAPTTSELSNNIGLDKTKSLNYEVGLKSRGEDFLFDSALFYNDVKDEIIQIKDLNNNSIYANAGKTQKIGFEMSGSYNITSEFSLIGAYAYSHFKYKNFQEKVGRGFVSRDGNYLPYIPKHQYSLEAQYRHASGLWARIGAKTWGSYYMDNANSEKYKGYEFVTNLMFGFQQQSHSIQLNVYNLFDKHYAMSAQKDVYGNVSYKAAAPRSVMLTYAYSF